VENTNLLTLNDVVCYHVILVTPSFDVIRKQLDITALVREKDHVATVLCGYELPTL